MLKVVMLTPGTGNFFCGSCLRDHSVAKGMIAEGLDVTMVPLYLPHVAEDDLKTSPLFFGGINVYLQRKFPLFSKSPKWFRKTLDHPALLKFVSRFSGMTSAKDLGEMTLDSLEMKGPQVEFEQMLQWMSESIKPDAVILSNCLLVGFAKRIKERLNCRVMATLQGEDSFLDSLQEPYASKSWEALRERSQDIDLFMPVSRTYGKIMSERVGITQDKMQTVYNGIDLEGLPVPRSQPETPAIGFLANIVPGKGLMTLAKAFVHLKKNRTHKELQMIILGSVTPFTKGHLEDVIDYLKASKVYEDVSVKTNLSREQKFEALRDISILSVPATYGESFGLYLLEACAMGIPVVQPDHGAFKEIVTELEAGLLCEPDDAEDLADKLEGLLLDESKRRSLGLRGKEVVNEKFSMKAMSKQVANIIKENHG